MGDLISRKETEKLLRAYADEVGCNRGEYELANGILKAVCYLDNIPTAFDLESVIRRLEENEQDMIKAIGENTPSGFYMVSVKDLKGMIEDHTKEQIKILKSAANATNGKNGR